jgi:uncharacterized protein YbaR (Trm112 family)
MPNLNEKILQVISCPITDSALILSDDGSELISKTAGLAFPIIDGIPVLLVEKSRRL